MKNIIIYGSTRSGKTTLAKQIKNEFHLNYIEIDVIKEAFKKINNIDTSKNNDFIVGQLITDNLAVYFEKLVSISNLHDEYYVIEGTALYLPELIKIISEKSFCIICMGYPNISPEEKLRELELFENDSDWTVKISREEKLQLCRDNINVSKYIQALANEYNLAFFDTSYSRSIVFNNVIKYLKGVI